MEYHLLADLLNKFHTSEEWIQALWLVCATIIALGALGALCWCCQEVMRPFMGRKSAEILKQK